MRIFVSYARVDKPYCIQIVDLLNLHEVWYDQRLYAGQGWWKEILRRLDWCEAFVFLLSPDAVNSKYCIDELELALSLGRYIIPVLIHPDTEIPEVLSETQFADLSKGLTTQSVQDLLNAIHMAEVHQYKYPNTQESLQAAPAAIPSNRLKPVQADGADVITMAAGAMSDGDYDQAVYLLRRAKSSGAISSYINIDSLLEEAEAGVKRVEQRRVAERDYRQIAPLVKHRSTHRFGCEAFTAFRVDFPDYDPENLCELCGCEGNVDVESLDYTNGNGHRGGEIIISTAKKPPNDFLPLLEWCEIPAGMVKVDTIEDQVIGVDKPVYVESFYMSKYPVTNEQYRRFLDDPQGYRNPEWWRFSHYVYQWHMENPEPQPSTFRGDEHPREMVSWYDAVAFCNWMSMCTGWVITLPSLAQRQRSIQGDDERVFPWGNNFDYGRCNTRESDIKMTTLVKRYPEGVSTYGVYDLVGNVWEWCLDTEDDEFQPPAIENAAHEKRAVHGGSFVSPYERAKVSFRYFLKPQTVFNSIGFRVIALTD